MFRKVLRVIGFLVAVAVIVAYICYASHLAKVHREAQTVSNIVIELQDSTSTQRLTSSSRIYEQLSREGEVPKDKGVDKVDAVSIANILERNGFVEDARVYTTYSGGLHISISEREPMLRLRVAGYDAFITNDGYVFGTPRGSACYTSVATGGYRPPFTTSFEGNLAELRKERKRRGEERLEGIYTEYKSIKAKQRELRDERTTLRKKRRKGIFESDENHTLRKQAVEANLAKIAKELQQSEQRVKEIEARQRKAVAQLSREERRFSDFEEFLAFAKRVRDDDFWSAEIVQMVVDTTSLGAISLRLIPRSGDFVVEFGTLDNTSAKLDKLRTFYDKGLSHLGWERYKNIDVRYNKQVICTE